MTDKQPLLVRHVIHSLVVTEVNFTKDVIHDVYFSLVLQASAEFCEDHTMFLQTTPKLVQKANQKTEEKTAELGAAACSQFIMHACVW